MAIPSSGQIALSTVQTEYGGSNPISLSEYYSGGANVPSGISGNNGTIPTSGEIQMGDFRGSENTAYVSATGGTITTSGNFKIHRFNSSATFAVNDGGNSAGSNTVEYLVVAGGGGAASGPSPVGGNGGSGMVVIKYQFQG
jgi:hypothetical protein